MSYFLHLSRVHAATQLQIMTIMVGDESDSQRIIASFPLKISLLWFLSAARVKKFFKLYEEFN